MSQECSLTKTFTCSLYGGRVDEGSVQLEHLSTCVSIPYIESQQLFTWPLPLSVHIYITANISKRNLDLYFYINLTFFYL